MIILYDFTDTVVRDLGGGFRLTAIHVELDRKSQGLWYISIEIPSYDYLSIGVAKQNQFNMIEEFFIEFWLLAFKGVTVVCHYED